MDFDFSTRRYANAQSLKSGTLRERQGSGTIERFWIDPINISRVKCCDWRSRFAPRWAIAEDT
ncbi:hypothetical protein [Nostoc sp.]|uniref:hypothetical protein n=1 Tax=Nostoc sp. TaxID=1180 RepID=UPI002FF791E0